MNIHNDAIANQAYTELTISCKIHGCSETMDKTLDHPATVPVEDWAVDMAKFAYQLGWTIGKDGCVLCPLHSVGDPDESCCDVVGY